MRNFSWIVPGRVAGMAYPDPGDARRLRALGVTAVLSLTERAPRFEPGTDLKTLHIPVADMAAPTPRMLDRAVRWIQAEVDAGGAVAVHCFAGMGRTGTVLAAYLVSTGLEPADAVEGVRSVRPGSVESVAQEHAVHRYAEAAGKAGEDR